MLTALIYIAFLKLKTLRLKLITRRNNWQTKRTWKKMVKNLETDGYKQVTAIDWDSSHANLVLVMAKPGKGRSHYHDFKKRRNNG